MVTVFNPTLLRLLRQNLYSLKRQYGTSVVYHSIESRQTDYKTGSKSSSVNTISIRHAIVLPGTFTQSAITGGAGGLDRASNKAGGLLIGDRIFMIDGTDLPNVTPKQGDRLVHAGEEYDIIEIQTIGEMAAFVLHARLHHASQP